MKMKPLVRSASAFLVVGFLVTCFPMAVPPDADATVFRLFGAGSRAISMGGAFSAIADDYTGGYYNPGGLLAKNTARFGFGYQYAKLQLTENGNDIPLAHSHRDGFVLGYAFTLPFLDFLKDRIALGYNLYQPPDYMMNIYVPKPSTPQFVLLESYTQANFMNVSTAVKIVDGLNVGAGIAFTADVGGSLDLKPGVRGMLGTQVIMGTVDQDAQTMLSGSAGLFVDIGKFLSAVEGLTFAFVWRDRYYVDLNIPVTIMLGTIPLKLDFSSNLIYTPQMYTLGLAYRILPDLLVSADIVYNRWVDFLSPSLEIHTDIKLPVIPLELLPGKVEDPNFSDTVTARFGAEYRVLETSWSDLILRGGYAYDPSPVPEQTGWSNWLDGNKHIFSVGVGLGLKRLFGKDFGKTRPEFQSVFQYQYIAPTHHTKTADIPKFYINPGYPTIEGEGDVYFFGVAIAVEYGE
jgi:long-chain fatty acid transport protein